MKCRPLAFALAVAAAACAADDAEVVIPTSAPILGGTAGEVGQYPTVVAIMNRGLCTGTLVAPDIILTAAHCISPSVLGYSSQTAVTNDTTVIFDATDVLYGSGRQVAAAETIPHPSFNVNALGDDDIGIIRLSESITDRAPTPLNRTYADAPPGLTVTQVGYGVTQPGNQNSAGRLYVLASKATTSCSPFGGSDTDLICFWQTDGTGKCEGDSGGPSFADIGGFQKIVGVTSFGDQTCQQFGADTRVDGELDFINQVAPELQCQTDGVCNESCGEGSLPVDADCPVCATDDECGDPTNLECLDGECHPRPGTPGGLGAECVANEECDSGICAAGPDGMRCVDLCTPGGAGECPADFDCLDAGGGNGACWPSEEFQPPGEDPGCGCRAGSRGAAGGGGLALMALALLAIGRRAFPQR